MAQARPLTAGHHSGMSLHLPALRLLCIEGKTPLGMVRAQKVFYLLRDHKLRDQRSLAHPARPYMGRSLTK